MRNGLDARQGLVSGLSLRSRVRSRVGEYGALLRWYRRLRPTSIWTRTNPAGRATRRFVAEHGLSVRRGPFAGLRYTPRAIGKVGFLPPKLLGIYEKELDGIFAAADHELFVDLGCGDGYFCVGYAMTHPDARVIGYETNSAEASIAREIAELNGVRVDFRGTADPDALSALPEGRLLLLVDVEGYERELLDPDRVPRLRTATIIVEAHLDVHPGLVEELTGRFDGSHDVTILRGQPRDHGDYEELSGWDERLARLAVSEGRPVHATWLHLVPR